MFAERTRNILIVRYTAEIEILTGALVGITHAVKAKNRSG